jgi:Tfp pilus assembly protein PilO
LYGKDAKKKDQKSDSLASYLPFTFSVSGQYQNIIMFTKQIENLRRPILFDSYSYSSSVTESEKKITLTVTGRLPYLQNENL